MAIPACDAAIERCDGIPNPFDCDGVQWVRINDRNRPFTSKESVKLNHCIWYPAIKRCSLKSIFDADFHLSVVKKKC